MAWRGVATRVVLQAPQQQPVCLLLVLFLCFSRRRKKRRRERIPKEKKYIYSLAYVTARHVLSGMHKARNCLVQTKETEVLSAFAREQGTPLAHPTALFFPCTRNQTHCAP